MSSLSKHLKPSPRLGTSSNMFFVQAQTCWGSTGSNACYNPYHGCDGTTTGTGGSSSGFNCRLEHIGTGTWRGECIADNQCSCTPGFGGYECQYATCSGGILWRPSADNSVCSGHGSCDGPNACRCWINNDPDATSGTQHWMGDNCQYVVCSGVVETSPLVCSNGKGTCADAAPTPLCTCTNTGNWGYTGDNCETRICDGDSNSLTQCSQHGDCVELPYSTVAGGRNKCDCHTGYTHAAAAGDDGICDHFLCFGIADHATPCSGHGTCTAPDTCQCSGAYTLSDCSSYQCQGLLHTDSQVCNGGRGTCQTNGECTSCVDGWDNGDLNNCEVKYCQGVIASSATVCSGHGQCNPQNRTQDDNKCFCDDGYLLADCSTWECFSVNEGSGGVCSGHGSCDSPNNCTCTDTAQYIGSNCDIPVCYGKNASDPLVCNGHGTCGPTFDTCTCISTYDGTECQYPICDGSPSNDGNVCNSHGTCTSPDNCECDPGYEGLYCDIKTCFQKYSDDPTVCSGHGTCTAPNTCSCSSSNWVGSQCQTPKCDNIVATDTNVCSGHGSCVDVDTCICEHAWSGTYCDTPFCVDRATTCNGHGDCSTDRSRCLCDENWTFASNCSIFLCYGREPTDNLVCNQHGDCLGVDTCSCFDYTYTGPQCDQVGCYGKEASDSTICGGSNGTCVAVDECDCRTDVGYLNTQCENPGCFGAGSDPSNVCSGHGECVGVDTCICETYWTSQDCSMPICGGKIAIASDVCSGHGTCVDANTCECSSSIWSGTDCQYPSCFGVPASDPFVCSGHGDCISPDVCECDNSTSFSGVNCEKAGCFGVVATDPNVCYGRGECIAKDTCLCQAANGIGSNCEINVCNNINGTDARVCNGRGQCLSTGLCQCNTGFGGSFCDQFICYDKLQTDPQVCSSEGICVGINQCQCNATRTGDQCQFKSCNGIPESTLCSGHGTCQTTSSFCFCEDNYYGNNCNQYFEVCNGTNAIGSLDNPCDNCIGGDGGLSSCSAHVSPQWTLSSTTSTTTLTGFYKVVDRPLNGPLVVDCVNVLSPSSLDLVGDFPVCSWKSLNSDVFVIELGSGHRVDKSTKLTFNMLPFTEGTDIYAETSTTETPVVTPTDPVEPTPEEPSSTEDDSNLLWLIGIIVPVLLIIIVCIASCCLICCLCFIFIICCVCGTGMCATVPAKKVKPSLRDQDYYVNTKLQEEYESYEAKKRRKEQERFELEKFQDQIETEKNLALLNRSKNQEHISDEDYEFSPPNTNPASSSIPYQWDQGTPKQEQPKPSFARVADAVMYGKDHPEENSVPYDFLLSFENGVISRTLSNRSKELASAARDRVRNRNIAQQQQPSPSPNQSLTNGGSAHHSPSPSPNQQQNHPASPLNDNQNAVPPQQHQNGSARTGFLSFDDLP